MHGLNANNRKGRKAEKGKKRLIPSNASPHCSLPKHFIESGVPVAFLKPFSMDMIQPQIINSIHLHHYGGLSETMLAYWRTAGTACLSKRQFMPFPVPSHFVPCSWDNVPIGRKEWRKCVIHAKKPCAQTHISLEKLETIASRMAGIMCACLHVCACMHVCTHVSMSLCMCARAYVSPGICTHKALYTVPSGMCVYIQEGVADVTAW